MSTEVKAELERIAENVAAAYTAAAEQGADMPPAQNTGNLAKTVSNIKTVKFTEQNLDESQKAQARSNIGALAADQLQDAVEDALQQAKNSGMFNGADGQPGQDGIDGVTPHVGSNGNWFIGETDTGIPATGPAGGQGLPGKDGEEGQPGKDGNDGVSATHKWEGTVLTITSASGTSSADLKGEPGRDGSDGQPGKDGTDGAAGRDGVDGKSAYQYARDAGYTGTEEEFAAKLAADAPEGDGVTVSNVAAPGQMLLVKSVDETGKPTEWETADHVADFEDLVNVPVYDKWLVRSVSSSVEPSEEYTVVKGPAIGYLGSDRKRYIHDEHRVDVYINDELYKSGICVNHAGNYTVVADGESITKAFKLDRKTGAYSSEFFIPAQTETVTVRMEYHFVDAAYTLDEAFIAKTVDALYSSPETYAAMEHSHKWEDIEDPVCGDMASGHDTVYWDGNIEGLVSVNIGSYGGVYYKVSDVNMQDTSIKNEVVVRKEDGSEVVYSAEDIQSPGVFNTTTPAREFIMITLGGLKTEIYGVVFPETGTYFKPSTRSVQIIGYEGAPYTKQLDERFIPDTIARVSDIQGGSVEYATDEEVFELLSELGVIEPVVDSSDTIYLDENDKILIM